jgi:hypothetical protein
MACSAADLVLIRGRQAHPVEEQQVRDLARFYGLELRVVEIESSGETNQVASLVRNPATLAVLIAGDVLAQLNRPAVFGALQRKGRQIPLMVYGISPATDENQLKLWSRGSIYACAPLESYRPKAVEVASSRGVTRQLSGVTLPAASSPTCMMSAEPESTVSAVLTAVDDKDKRVPVLLRATFPSQDVFFAPSENSFRSQWTADKAHLPEAFSAMAPMILFLSYSAGDFAWHLDGHYANLTIDDAWLTEPFGNLNYADLLAQMQRHNFHTTVAFVPWNFDRNKADVTALFRSHPDRYSVCIHGNNHAHREFGDYKANPLARQIADIDQGVARMDRFFSLTGAPYDRFMVFPHGVAPEQTFVALMGHGFQGTANASNVPLGSPPPTDRMLIFRSYTSTYGGLLSFYRYSASENVPKSVIAIHAFLGNPLLFYDHASLFRPGISAFNERAELVNEVEPGTQWRSLGEIARHASLQRQRLDGGIDVKMLSTEMTLQNPSGKPVAFYIERAQGGMLTIDGRPTEDDAYPTVQVAIPAHESRVLRLDTPQAHSPSNVKLRDGSIRVYVLRMASDFRDLYLSRSSFGASLIQLYYQRNLDSAEMFVEKNWELFLLTCVIVIAAGRYVCVRKRLQVREKSNPLKRQLAS